VSSEPVPLSESLGGVVRSLRGAGAREDGSGASARQLGGVFGRWKDAVGEAVARHVQPLRLDGTRLVVEVDDPAWATQLKFLEANLRERLLAVTGAQIDEFEIRVSRR
jgi:predicted nucleic acid-binding Zn ribbon protein